jgi:hypothetical protein
MSSKSILSSKRILGLAAGLLILVCSASPSFARGRAVAAITGKVLDRMQVIRNVPLARMGTMTYAEVNSEWLTKFYQDYRSELNRLGIVKWNERFDCRRFAGLYAELAQSKFFVESFQSENAAQSLAVGQVWYNLENGKGAHAIIVALTERGRIFIEPQTGKEVTLTQKEVGSIFFSLI